jgi:hypothetical protein
MFPIQGKEIFIKQWGSGRYVQTKVSDLGFLILIEKIVPGP